MDEYASLISEAGADRAGLRKLRDLKDPKVLEILNYWYAHRGSRRMPSPNDIDPIDFARHLPHLMMLQVDYEPFRLTYRLIGEHVAYSHGTNFKGRSVLDVNDKMPKLGTLLFELYRAVAELKRPVGVGGEIEFAGGGYMSFEAAYMPLSFTGERTDRIFTVSVYREISARQRFENELSMI
ncbi:MAG: PAS domain-containing protein [Pseudomonadota bacterium]